jgi:hypothetical protein
LTNNDAGFVSVDVMSDVPAAEQRERISALRMYLFLPSNGEPLRMSAVVVAKSDTFFGIRGLPGSKVVLIDQGFNSPL